MTRKGEALEAVLRQPKRLALLAYLAVAVPHRFHRRDTLLALFWPEFDQEHARAALRRALYFLRSALGAEVVAGRGDDEVGVSDGALWCDAAAMEQLLAAGDSEAALALYRGPLLDGLYVAGASVEFQDWLDRERIRLRERAADAARALVTQAESDGRLDAAAGWARRVLELAPDDEAALRQYLRVLDRTGERLVALRAYDEFARRLAQELELEPSAETRAVAEGLRARTAAAAASPSTIAVLPFSVRGDARLAYLREGMVDLLATKLDGAGDIRTVDPRALLQAAARDAGTAAGRDLTPDEAGMLARRFGAGRYLLGSVVEAGGRLQATAALYAGDGARRRQGRGRRGRGERAVRAGGRARPPAPGRPRRGGGHATHPDRGAHHRLARRAQGVPPGRARAPGGPLLRRDGRVSDGGGRGPVVRAGLLPAGRRGRGMRAPRPRA